MKNVDYEDVLNFWFEELEPKNWFQKSDEVDEAIRTRFEHLIEPVHAGKYSDWLEVPEGRLAAILVLDQFPRNLYRREPRSFAYDGKALELVQAGLQNGVDLKLGGQQRVFFYLPLEHSEDIDDQDLSLAKFSQLVLDVQPERKELFRRYLDYAWRHYEIVKRFGRYPHRNDILGRESSSKEKKFLTQPGSSFL